jgi:O-succinylhomoserine sulfhydrylase
MKTKTGTDREITKKWARQTQMVRAGTMRSNFGELSEALFLTSGFAYECAEDGEGRFDGTREGYTYTRQSNPTVSMLEERLALLEGADRGRATATGMAAMSSAILCQVRAGDHVLASQALFGSNRWLMDELLPRYGVETTVVNGADLNAWKAEVRPNTKVFFTETPANPTLEVVDIKAVADIAHTAGALLVVDNVFATPVLQRPMDLGADVVCYSTTKHIDGQGRCMGGIVLSKVDFDDEHYFPYYRHLGIAMSPFNAWVTLKGVETLGIRVHAMCDNAEKLAHAIAEKVVDTRHPVLENFKDREVLFSQMERGGTMVVFDLPGGRDQAFKFLNALEIVDISNNLGDSRSIATHPWSTTHKALAEETRLSLGISRGLIRLSVGLEDGDDLVRDVIQALGAAGL